MTVNHKDGVTNKFYLLLEEILEKLKVLKKKAEKTFKYDIEFESQLIINHIEDYIEKNKTWLKG